MRVPERRAREGDAARRLDLHFRGDFRGGTDCACRLRVTPSARGGTRVRQLGWDCARGASQTVIAQSSK
jgi:hypothetical protein